jgi:DnaJ-class molecular chaperone
LASERPADEKQPPADGEQSQADGEQPQAGERTSAGVEQECMPCGGRGTLISRLGGQESELRCPWCEGSGQRRAGVDAQAGWLAERDAAASESSKDASTDASLS